MHRSSVPAKAGTQNEMSEWLWVPAFAGTNGVCLFAYCFIPAAATTRVHFAVSWPDVVGELLRRAAEHVDALLLQGLDDVARLDRIVGGACELLDDVAWRSGGHRSARSTRSCRSP